MNDEDDKRKYALSAAIEHSCGQDNARDTLTTAKLFYDFLSEEKTN